MHTVCIFTVFEQALLTHWRNMSPEKDRQEIKNRAMCTAPAASGNIVVAAVADVTQSPRADLV